MREISGCNEISRCRFKAAGFRCPSCEPRILVIMAPIPLTLVGILPAHALMGAFFTATSMIGFIAGAGIIVRNSIILVDFIELRRSQGMSLEEAVVDAGAVRFRPMLLTAAAVVVGASVITIRSDFSRLGPVVNGGRSGLHGAVAYGGAGPLLLVPKGWERGSTQASAFPGKYC